MHGGNESNESVSGGVLSSAYTPLVIAGNAKKQ